MRYKLTYEKIPLTHTQTRKNGNFIDGKIVLDRLNEGKVRYKNPYSHPGRRWKLKLKLVLVFV